MDIIATSNTLYENTSLTRKAGFAHIQSKEDLTLHNLRKLNPEYIFFVHWSYIIPAEIYEIYPCVIFGSTQIFVERAFFDEQVGAFQQDPETIILEVSETVGATLNEFRVNPNFCGKSVFR